MTRAPGEPTSDPERDRLAAASFTHVRLREGYRIAEVDAFVARALHELGSGDPTLRPEDVRTVRFRPVRVREGYDMREVDDYLDDLERQLAGYHHPAAAVEQQPPHGLRRLLRADNAQELVSRLTWALLLLVLTVWLLARLAQGSLVFGS